jgi:fucose 4-O-acetylase-like acetyltransferase
MAWFTLFPFGCWAIAGLLVGHWWVRASRAGREARALLASGGIGVVLIVATVIVRSLDPPLVRYSSVIAQQMGYGSFFLRLGVLGICATVSYLAVRWARPGRFSAIRQLGQTSLLVYWVHIELCYGGIVWPLRKRLTMVQVGLGLVLLTFLMLGLSLFRTRVWPSWGPRLAASLRLTRPAAEANLRRP